MGKVRMDCLSPDLGPGVDQLASTISLRHFNLSDTDDLMLWATDDQVTRFCRWDTYTSREQAVEFIESSMTHPYMRAICLENRAIGAISVASNSGNDRCRAELGYVLASGYWGRGIATRAVKLVTSTIFIEWPHLERLEALVDVENKASLRVLEKAGFKREGVLRKYLILKGGTRDMVIFSLLSTDIQENTIIAKPAVVTQQCTSLESLKI